MRGLDPNHALEPLADGNSVDAQSDRSATQIPARPIAFGPAMPSPADAPNTNHNQRPETANQDAGANHPINPLAELGPTIPYAADDLTDGRTLPPLALDGHCAVTLLEKETWEPGDSRYGVLHMGSLYLFVSPEAQQKFLEDPHRYAPMLAGIDVVKLIEEQRVIPGQRQFGRFYPDPGERRVYLFADEASANRFGVDPDHYMRLAEAIMQQALKGSSESPAARRTK
jgi:protein disulfide-isomerase